MKGSADVLSLVVDLRERVVGAVGAGAFRHQAAERFGVSLASASWWCRQFAREGHVTAEPMSGDQRSHRTEAQPHQILALYEQQPGIYLHELRAALAKRGLRVARSSLSRVFKRHNITLKRMTRPACRMVDEDACDRSAQTYPVSRHGGRRQDGEPRVSGLISTSAWIGRFLC